MSSPLRTGPTPAGVPVKMRSPGLISTSADRNRTISGTFQIMSERSPRWRVSPFTLHSIAPLASGPIPAFGVMAPAGGGKVEAFRHIPRPALFLRRRLNVAPRHVEPDGVAEDQLIDAIRLDVPAAAAEGDDKFDLVLEIEGRWRIGDDRAIGSDRIGGLREEEWRIGVGIAAHFPRMFGVVLANAEDAAHRERLPRGHSESRSRAVGERRSRSWVRTFSSAIKYWRAPNLAGRAIRRRAARRRPGARPAPG